MTPSRDELVDAAIKWMAGRIDRALQQRRHAVASDKQGRLSAIAPILRKLTSDFSIVADAPRPEWHRARAEARRCLELGAKNVSSEIASELAAVLCVEWKQPRAANLSRAWLEGTDFDVESLMSSDHSTLALIVGVAAAAVILAVVMLVRRGRAVRLPQRRELAPSSDFNALLAISLETGQAAAIAVRLKEAIAEPWSWRVQDALAELTMRDKRVLLGAFAEHATGNVKRITAAAGDRFDARSMTAPISKTNDDEWIVTADVSSEDAIGFLVGDRVAIPAQVQICTADWWVLSQSSCPIGSLISDRAEELIAGGRSAAAKWRAPWGLAHPEDLRKLVNESVIDTWRRRLVEELNAHYERRPERCVQITGNPGDMFETSTMEAAGTPPIGDAIVVDVAERDGVKQFGLACPGGSPLLLAVVHAKPSRIGS